MVVTQEVVVTELVVVDVDEGNKGGRDEGDGRGRLSTGVGAWRLAWALGVGVGAGAVSSFGVSGRCAWARARGWWHRMIGVVGAGRGHGTEEVPRS